MSKKTNDNEVVVSFKSKSRNIFMYFTQTPEGDLDMQMSCDPEFDPEKESEPDLCLLLASTLMNALNPDVETKKEDDINPKVYDGTDKIYS